MRPIPYCAAEDELQAYADGILPADRKAIIESYLGAAPDEQERVESYRRLNVELHRMYDRPEFASTPLCYEFLAGELARAVRRQRRMRRMTRYAAALFVVIGGAATTLAGYHLYQGQTQLVAANAQVVKAEQVADTHDGTHFVPVGNHAGPDRMAGGAHAVPAAAHRDSRPLTQAAGLQQKAPDLVRLGFELTSGKVVTTGDGPAVELSYRGKGDHRMTLSIKPADSVHKTAFTILEDSDASLVSWQIGGFTYSLVGDVGRQKLLALARAVSDSLQFPGTDDGTMPKPSRTAAQASPIAAPDTPQVDALKLKETAVTTDGAHAAAPHLSDAASAPAEAADAAPAATVQKIGLKPPE